MVEMNSKFGLLRSSAQPIHDQMIEETIRCMDLGKISDRIYQPDTIQNFLNYYDDWIQSSTLNNIQGFDGYGRYMTFAITHAIEQFLMKHRNRRIRTFRGEYPGTMDLIFGYNLDHLYIDDDVNMLAGDAVIVSLPFSGSGNKHLMLDLVLERCASHSIPMMIDCAFFGMCKDINLQQISCIETVAFSLSKCYSMNNYRIGMIYSKDPPFGIELLQRFGYTSRVGAIIAMDLFNKFSPDYIYNKYSKIQSMVCNTLGDMIPSDTVIFGNGGRCWAKFDRGASHNRVSFGNFLSTLAC